MKMLFIENVVLAIIFFWLKYFLSRKRLSMIDQIRYFRSKVMRETVAFLHTSLAIGFLNLFQNK
jgi:hypothetical protein